MSLADTDREFAIAHKNLAASSQRHARATEAQLRAAEQGAIERLAAPEPFFYPTAEENPNPLKEIVGSKVLSLSAFLNLNKLFVYNDVINVMYGDWFDGYGSFQRNYTPNDVREIIKAGQAKGYELPRFQEALLAHKRHYPSPLVAGLGVVAQHCMHFGAALLGAYAIATLAVTGVMRALAEEREATFAAEKMTTATGTPWAANVPERVMIKGRLPKIGEPAVQVYRVDTQALCSVTQVRNGFLGISERMYDYTCQSFDITNKDSLTAFAPPVAAWHRLTGVPETDSSVLAKFVALSALYTHLDNQEKALRNAYSLTNNARRQTGSAAAILAGAKP